MTNNSPLDEHIKEKFGNYTPDVPPHIWENIIAEKEKRRPAGFWFSFLNKNSLLLLLGIVIAGTGIVIYKNVSSPTSTYNKITVATEPVKTTSENNNTNSLKTNTTSAINIPSATNSDQVSSVENILETQVNKTNNHNTVEKSTVAGEKNNVNNKKKNNAGDLPADNTQNNITFTASNNNTSKRNSNKKPRRLKGSAALSYTSPDAEVDDMNISGTASTDLLLKRLLLNLDMIRAEKTLNASITKINNPHLEIPCPEAEKNAAGNKRYFELYGGPDYAFTSITDTGNSAYMQKRKESTSFSSAFSAGLRYTRVFSNGMSFRTGINYSQINEKFKFAQGNVIQVIYITNNNGDTTGSYTTTGTRYKTTYNKFRTIDIPILVGYELGNGRLHANFNAGAIVNLYSWQKGDVLDTAYQPISITTGKATSAYQFKTNVGIGFIGAVSVYYKLTDKWHIFAEPYFRYNFSPASKAALTLKQKYSTAGLRLGIRLDF